MIVTFEVADGIATVKMDDGKANALSYAMLEALGAALDRAEKEAAAVVLVGRAGRFCAGFDLQEMMSGPDAARALVMRGGALLLRLYTLPMPLVVACTGHALAGGALLVATGDVRVAAAGPFKIGLNEVQIGMPVPVLAMELARDRVAPRDLAAATLFATIYDPEEAQRVGWVDEVAPADALLARATAHAKRLTALSRDAYARTKLAMRERTVDYVRATMEKDMARLTGPAT